MRSENRGQACRQPDLETEKKIRVRAGVCRSSLVTLSRAHVPKAGFATIASTGIKFGDLAVMVLGHARK